MGPIVIPKKNDVNTSTSLGTISNVQYKCLIPWIKRANVIMIMSDINLFCVIKARKTDPKKNDVSTRTFLGTISNVQYKWRSRYIKRANGIMIMSDKILFCVIKARKIAPKKKINPAYSLSLSA